MSDYATPEAKRKPGPKPFLDDKKRAVATALFAVGFSQRDVAKRLGCAHSTIRHTARQSPEFAEQIREAQLQCELDALNKINAAGGKSWRAAAWLLERTRPERYEKTNRKQPTYEEVVEFWDRCRGAITNGMSPEQRRVIKQRLCVLSEQFASQTDWSREQAEELAPRPSPARQAPPRDVSDDYYDRCRRMNVRPMWEYVPGFGLGEKPSAAALFQSPVVGYLQRMRDACKPPSWNGFLQTSALQQLDAAAQEREIAEWQPRFQAWEEEYSAAERAADAAFHAAHAKADASRRALQEAFNQRQPGALPGTDCTTSGSTGSRSAANQPEVASPTGAPSAPGVPATFERVAGVIGSFLWLLPFLLGWAMGRMEPAPAAPSFSPTRQNLVQNPRTCAVEWMMFDQKQAASVSGGVYPRARPAETALPSGGLFPWECLARWNCDGNGIAVAKERGRKMVRTGATPSAGINPAAHKRGWRKSA